MTDYLFGINLRQSKLPFTKLQTKLTKPIFINLLIHQGAPGVYGDNDTGVQILSREKPSLPCRDSQHKSS